MLSQVHIYVIGDVIGVGFRAWVKMQAKMSGIHGWVRNNFESPDIFGKGGGVEAVLQGEESTVDNLVEIIRQGSPISRVEDIEVIHQDAKTIFETFDIRK